MTNDFLIKCHMHNCSKIIYMHHKFHEISFIGYLVMAEDGSTGGRTDGQRQTNISPKMKSRTTFKIF